jgi:hypothetical protein
LRAGFRQLLALTQTIVFEQQNTHANDPSNIFPANVSLPEAYVSPAEPLNFGPPVALPSFFDLGNDCDLMEFFEDEADDFQIGEANCDSILELMDDESDVNNISLEYLDEVFEPLNSMIDAHLSLPNSQYPSQSFNLPEAPTSPPPGNENPPCLPPYIRTDSRCKFDREWKKFDTSDKSDVARYGRALDELFRRGQHRIPSSTVFDKFDLIPFL